MDLSNSLRILLANLFSTYYKAHSFHWNVEGVLFTEMHSFFGEVYSELHGSVDVIAEKLRTLGEYAPMSLTAILEYRTVQDTVLTGDFVNMLAELSQDNKTIINSLYTAFNSADSQNEQGIANYLADRIEYHEKLQWMLNSKLK